MVGWTAGNGSSINAQRISGRFSQNWSNYIKVVNWTDSSSISIGTVCNACNVAECVGQKNWESDSTRLSLGTNASWSSRRKDAADGCHVLMHWSHRYNSSKPWLPRRVLHTTCKSLPSCWCSLLMIIPALLSSIVNIDLALVWCLNQAHML